jgi:basic membrane lipoprotein Med (substrate-binding protein (PBP1-ABC) superfamily)
MARMIIGAAALTLLASSVAGAQSATPPPDQYGPSLRTSVITSSLDDPTVNALIEDTARQYHRALGGELKDTNKVEGGWWPVAPQPGTAAVVEALFGAAQDSPSVIIISGGDSQLGVGIAGNNSFGNTVFIDLGQRPPCVTGDGQPDPSGVCEGGTVGIPFNYSAVEFAVEDGAYLAGVLAADASRNGRLGIISGFAGCVECNRYVEGFAEGARSVEPDIDIEVAYLADDEVSGFGDTVSAATFTKAFVDVFDPDVVLPVGRGATIGMVEAVCDAGKLAVGTGIDVTAQRPDLDCVLASVVPDVGRAVEESLYAFADGNTELPQVVTFDLVDDRVRVTDEWTGARSTTLPVDTPERFQSAQTAILTGQVDTCPGDCGVPPASAVEEPPTTEEDEAPTEDGAEATPASD